MAWFRTMVAVWSLIVAGHLACGEARAQSLIAEPGTSGDQLLFFFDATPGRTAFLVVSNTSTDGLTLEIAWYSQDLSRRLATQIQGLASGANVVLDPGQVPGVAGNAGLTVVTPVVSSGDTRPIVPAPLRDTLRYAPSGSLVGGFTLANLSSNSAFGQNPLARIAVDVFGNRAQAGAIVDGTAIRYQRIAPDFLLIPFYFNPAGGALTDRAFLAGFEDRYSATGFSIGSVSLGLGFKLIDVSGNEVASGTIPVNGVAFTDLQTLAGGTPFTSSGKALLGFDVPLPANANLLGLMSQSLGTFAVGQGLPGYFADRGPDRRFVDNGDGTITDRQTGLQWEKKTTDAGSGENLADPHDVDNNYTWSATPGAPDGTVFTSFLTGLNHGAFGVGNCAGDGITQTGGFARHCDWRLPTREELLTIADLTVPGCRVFDATQAPCIDPIFFPIADSTAYWSGTPLAGTNEAVLVRFDVGLAARTAGSDLLAARAVRGGR
jgi:hypothetical protein